MKPSVIVSYGFLICCQCVLLASCKQKPAVSEQQTKTASQKAQEESDPWASETLIKPQIAEAAKPVSLPPRQNFSLPNGLQVGLIRDTSLPLVNLHLVVHGGTDEESLDKRSQASFVALMLTKGTVSKSADEIAGAIDNVGGRLHSWADEDGIHIGCMALSKDFLTCVRLLSDVVQNPTFPVGEMQTVRDQLISDIRNSHDEPMKLAHMQFLNLLFGPAHVRGVPPTQDSIQAIERNDLRTWHNNRFLPNNASLMIVGAVDAKMVRSGLKRAFGKWKPKKLPQKKLYRVPSVSGIKIRLVDKPNQTQTHIVAGHLGLAHADPQFHAVNLVDFVLGGGTFSSRLIRVIRSEKGKIYRAASRFEKRQKYGAFWIWTFTRTSETVNTLNIILDQIGKMAQNGPTEHELQGAKAYLAGRHQLMLQKEDDLASAMLTAQLHGLGDDYVAQYPLRISKVSLSQAKAAARAHLSVQNIVVVLVANAQELGPQLSKAGFRFEQVGFLDPIVPDLGSTTRGQNQANKRGLQLIELALAAKGGVKRLSALKSICVKGKGTITKNNKITQTRITAWYLLPDKRRLDLELSMGTLRSVIAGDKAWGGMGAVIKDMPAKMVAREKETLWRHQDLILLRPRQEPDVVVQAQGTKELDGKSFYVIRLQKPGMGDTHIWLDAQSYLIRRIQYTRDEQEVLEEFADYRWVGGIQMAYRQTRRDGDSRAELNLEQIQTNCPIGLDIFSK